MLEILQNGSVSFVLAVNKADVCLAARPNVCWNLHRTDDERLGSTSSAEYVSTDTNRPYLGEHPRVCRKLVTCLGILR